MKFTAVAFAFAVGLLSRPGRAAEIVIENADDPGVGFNDSTPATPIGDNTAATRGEQALAAFQKAASLWGAALDSTVPIRVSARFAPLACTATTGVLGSGTPHSFVRDTPGARPGVWYPIALADRLAGKDLAPSAPAIDAVFNGAAGNPDCLAGSGWYLGLDGNSGNLTDLVTAVTHELAHGLGMTTPVDLDTGALRDGLPDVFSLFVFDERSQTHWSDMTDAARAESARAFHQLSWDGPAVTAAAPALLVHGMPELALGAPLGALDPAIAVAAFGPALPQTPVAGPLSAVADDTNSPSDACGTVSDLTGKVAFVEAGGCSDVEKVLAVQAANAVAAVLVSDSTSFVPLPPSGDGGGNVTIPSVRINQKDAASIRAALGGSPTAQLFTDTARAIGTSREGRVYLYATDPVQAHKSVTHWDPVIVPHLLMQPTQETTHDLDLTLPLMRDIGWQPFRCGNGIVEGTEQCDDGPDAGGSTTCSTSCMRISTADAGDAGSADAGARDASVADAGVADGGTQESGVDTTPPGPNRYVDAGPPQNAGPGGIIWAPRHSGCSCRVGADADSRGAPGALAGLALGVAALLERRRSAATRRRV